MEDEELGLNSKHRINGVIYTVTSMFGEGQKIFIELEVLEGIDETDEI
jgi:hypothetical protein